MKITEETTVAEVKEQTMSVFMNMCDPNLPVDRGISRAEDVMDDFMTKLNNDEFKKDTMPQYDEGFDPSNESEAERILEGYQNLLHEIDDLKKLELK